MLTNQERFDHLMVEYAALDMQVTEMLSQGNASDKFIERFARIANELIELSLCEDVVVSYDINR